MATLIDDLYDRGLHQKVSLVVTGEFGRTPRLENRDGKIGRDHYPGAMSILIAGGGVRGGQVVGATSRYGEYPTERPLDPQDVLATVYRHLGIDPAMVALVGNPSRAGRSQHGTRQRSRRLPLVRRANHFPGSIPSAGCGADWIGSRNSTTRSCNWPATSSV